MILVVVMELRGDCCKPHLKVPQEGEETEEVTASWADANEISTDAAVVAVLSEPDGIFTVGKAKEQHQRLFCMKEWDVASWLNRQKIWSICFNVIEGRFIAEAF